MEKDFPPSDIDEFSPFFSGRLSKSGSSFLGTGFFGGEDFEGASFIQHQPPFFSFESKPTPHLFKRKKVLNFPSKESGRNLGRGYGKTALLALFAGEDTIPHIFLCCVFLFVERLRPWTKREKDKP